jgi:hypothetical protein
MSLKLTLETTFLLGLTNAQQYGPELHTDANAASDPNGNEADATTGWIPTAGLTAGSNIFESQSSVVNTGSYALHADANDTPTSGAAFQYQLTDLEDGATYRVTFNWRHIGTGERWQAYCEATVLGTITNTETTFVGVDTSFVADGTFATFSFIENSSQNNGGVYVDNFSVKKVL